MTRPVTAILGIGAGLGASLARETLRAGHDVLIADGSEKRIDAVRDSIGSDASYLHEVLHTHLGLRNCLAAVRESYGRVDHAIYVPEIPKPDHLSELELDAFDRSLGTTSRGAAIALRLFSDQMAEQDPIDEDAVQRHPQRGAFTFILSLSALLADPKRFSESVTQNAVVGVMRAGALALAPKRIRVNAIAAVRPRAEKDEVWLSARTPLGRAALADEIARTALFMNSPDSGFMTGQVVTLDGGRSILNGVVEDD